MATGKATSKVDEVFEKNFMTAAKFSVEHGTYANQFGFHGTWQLEAYIRRLTS